MLGYIKNHALNMQNGAQKAKDEFLRDFERNPAHALEWSSKVYSAVAEGEIGARVLDVLAWQESLGTKEEEALEALKRQALLESLRLAGQVMNKSTSEGANLLEAARTQAWAKFARWINGQM